MYQFPNGSASSVSTSEARASPGRTLRTTGRLPSFARDFLNLVLGDR